MTCIATGNSGSNRSDNSLFNLMVRTWHNIYRVPHLNPID